MKNIFFSIATLFMFSGCGNKSTSEATVAEAAVTATTAPQTVILTREQLQRAGIELGQPEQRSIAATLTANGTVVVLPEDKATVSSKIGGRIEQFFIHEGQQVQKGQALMRIASSAVFDIQQAYLQAKADLIFLDKELERQKTLSAQNVGATKLYEEAQSKYFRAKGDLQTAAAKLEYLGIGLENLNHPDQLKLANSITVRAPISGNVSEIPVNIGANVGEGTSLCNIIGLDDLHAHIAVFAKDMAFVQPGQAVTVRFPNTAYPPLNTKIEYISREIDQASKTYALHIGLPTAKGHSYLPGMPVVADIQLQGGAPGLALPEAAVLHDGNSAYCFIAVNPGGDNIEFQKVAFEPSAQGGGYVGVPPALLDGKTVVLRGANLVDGEMRRGEMEE